MNITLTDTEVREAITKYLSSLHITVPTDKDFVVEVNDLGLVCAKIEGAQLVFAPTPEPTPIPHSPVARYEPEPQAEDLSEFSGPAGPLGAAIDRQRTSWGLSTASTNLMALGKKDPADYLDEIGDPSPSGRY